MGSRRRAEGASDGNSQEGAWLGASRHADRLYIEGMERDTEAMKLMAECVQPREADLRR